MAVYAALGLATFMGMGALALDLGRFMHLHTDLQSAADAAALAGAAELNGEPALANGMLGARARAEAAAKNALFANTQVFATDGGGDTVAVDSVEFLSSLSPDTAATSDRDAAFVRVTVAERTVTGALIRPLLGEQNLTTSASAVAGMNQVVCEFPPMMICNPNEAAFGAGAPFEPVRGQLILLKAQTGNSQWAPGAFGLLDTPLGDTTPKGVAHHLGSSRPNGCYGREVDIRPGQVDPTKGGINVRFDIYQNPFFHKGAQAKWSQEEKNEFRPALNVTKGRVKSGNACDAIGDPAKVKPLPIDDCFFTNTCPHPRLGDGVWDRDGYWSVNHGGTLPAALTGATRYDVYRYEIDNDLIPDNSGTGGEDGNPSCYKSISNMPDADDEPDRRQLNVAIVNCMEHSVKGNADDVKVEAFAKLFIIRPMLKYDDDPSPSDGNLWAEVVAKLEPEDDSGVLHNIVQLYR